MPYKSRKLRKTRQHTKILLCPGRSPGSFFRNPDVPGNVGRARRGETAVPGFTGLESPLGGIGEDKTMRVTLSAALLVAFTGAAHATELFNNGSMVTHPGAGPGGVDVSMADALLNTAGSNVLQQPSATHFRIADDFAVGGPGWIVDTVRVFAYVTGNQTGTPLVNGNVHIRSGAPNDPGSTILATSAVFTQQYSGVNRIFNNAALSNVDRRVFAADFDFGGLNLAPGTYWIDFQFSGSASAWAPYVMLPNPANPNDPTTVFGNGMQMTVGEVWQPTLAAPGAEVPFIVFGEIIPAPGTLALLGMGGLLAARRRRA
jgi:hypothetical protein